MRDTRGRVIAARFTEQEAALVTAVATLAHTTMSDLVRESVLPAARSKLATLTETAEYRPADA